MMRNTSRSRWRSRSNTQPISNGWKSHLCGSSDSESTSSRPASAARPRALSIAAAPYAPSACSHRPRSLQKLASSGSRSAAQEQAAGGLGQTADFTQPVDSHQLDFGGTGAAQPRAYEGIETGRQRICHGADIVAGARHESEETRMIDMQHIGEDVPL